MTTTGGARERNTGGLAQPSAPPLRWRRVFPGHERELSALRRWLSSLLPECPERDDVLIVANELGANAIQHTASGRGGRFAVEVAWHRSMVQVAVADWGGPAEPKVIDDPDGEHGRGLLLVRALSVRTGVAGDQRGRLVWSQLAWHDADGTAPAPSQDPYQAAINDGEAALARRFAGVPAWFGRATLRWWALPGSGDLISAPSAPELAALLYRLEETACSLRPEAGGQAHRAAAEEEPGPPVAWRQSPPAQRPQFGARPGGPAASGVDVRHWQQPHRALGGIPRRARVLSSSSRLPLAPAALFSGAA
jgi:Histidine kinase-like ATPase domain